MIAALRASDVRQNLERVQMQLAGAGRAPGSVQILAAVKYLPADQLGELVTGGVTLVGENRAQDLVQKAELHPEFTWDFIGTLQSRKVAALVEHARYIHSVASDSALEQLGKHKRAHTRILVQVNVAGEAGKSGILPAQLSDFIARSPVPVIGLMTMPPNVERAEHNRRHFAALAQLAADHHLNELSMGTSQDYVVAAEEGATIIRLGSTLFARTSP